MDNALARLSVSNDMVVVRAIVGGTVRAIVWAKNISSISSNVLNVGVLPHSFGNAYFKTA
jgi:hypothetical protein